MTPEEQLPDYAGIFDKLLSEDMITITYPYLCNLGYSAEYIENNFHALQQEYPEAFL